MAIKIEKGIPFKNGTDGMPFDKMEVGDSFLLPKDAVYTTVRVRASLYCKAHLKKGNFFNKKSR